MVFVLNLASRGRLRYFIGNVTKIPQILHIPQQVQTPNFLIHLQTRYSLKPCKNKPKMQIWLGSASQKFKVPSTEVKSSTNYSVSNCKTQLKSTSHCFVHHWLKASMTLTMSMLIGISPYTCWEGVFLVKNRGIEFLCTNTNKHNMRHANTTILKKLGHNATRTRQLNN